MTIEKTRENTLKVGWETEKIEKGGTLKTLNFQ